MYLDFGDVTSFEATLMLLGVLLFFMIGGYFLGTIRFLEHFRPRLLCRRRLTPSEQIGIEVALTRWSALGPADQSQAVRWLLEASALRAKEFGADVRDALEQAVAACQPLGDAVQGDS